MDDMWEDEKYGCVWCLCLIEQRTSKDESGLKFLGWLRYAYPLFVAGFGL